VAAYHRKAMELNPYQLNSIRNADEAHSKRVNIINCVDDEIRVELGKPTPMSGKAAYDALKTAVADLRDGKIDVLVTAPIQKKAIQSDEFQVSRTHRIPWSRNWRKEFDADGEQYHESWRGYRSHSFKRYSSTITIDLIMAKLRTLNRTLIEDFAIRRPRIAVLGLNPHAGDDGLLGQRRERCYYAGA
jgi:4-hydroxy-L-threonine phosphate dehydrogenase PdxA